MQIDLNKKSTMGPMKPVHGISNGPLSMGGWTNMSAEYIEIGVPFVRLHDTDYPFPQQIDVPAIFRNLEADPYDEASYDFLLSDQYIEAIAGTGAEIIYRLGTSIEHMKIKRYVSIVPEPHKFAIVCEHIIRHYNEGWANGHHYGIKRWEIWNEPESARMWSGTPEQYYELYEVTSKHLKEKFGDSIMVGGYAFTGFYGLNPGAQEYAINFVKYFHNFVEHISAHNCPLDFFSYHYYGVDPQYVTRDADYVTEHLEKAGYKNVELIVDEWNTSGNTSQISWIKSLRGARYVLDIITAYSNSKVNIATYYDGQPHTPWCGLFDPLRQKMKPFFAFCMYGELYRLGTRIEVKSDCDNSILAATNGEKTGLLIVGSEQSEHVVINGFDNNAEAIIIDEERNNDPFEISQNGNTVTFEIPAGAIVYIYG